MSSSIHIASPEESLASIHIAFQCWGRDRTLDEYVEVCQRSLRRKRAECWVLTEGGEVLSSLLLYPLSFWHLGERCSGFGFGSVCTRPDARRQGRCHRLCQFVIEVAKRRGEQFGLLFSDLDPNFYGRMGFSSLTKDYYVCQDIEGLKDSGPRVTLVALNPEHRRDFLMQRYASYHRDLPISIARSSEYWDYSLQANEDFQFLSMEDNQGVSLGYVRYWRDQNMLIPVELVTEHSRNPGLLEETYRALAQFAFETDTPMLRGWQKPPEACLRFYRSEMRQKAWPMLWVHPELKVNRELLCDTFNPYGSDYF